ncbi:transmembrane protein 26-like isoform X2 [Takifugu flavidus]|uniref:Transmembrane protein 26 n=1 Tax=Takifugu flavidus TaxID=433684 RepID=A0A5C6PEW0_9TELE|nr:transmembrane protein 26-like isoform X2 [Takifugu flavidus]TWW78324.1 Transmembrane protein 26 [Takifugu flavidus]
MQQSRVTDLFKLIRAIIVRALFILVALTGVWRVTWVKKDLTYWFLTLLLLPLVLEMIITLRNRKGKDYKWFSPAIFLFMVSIIPSIWVLELHQQNKDSEPLCKRLDSLENIRLLVDQNITATNQTYPDYLKIVNKMLTSVCSNDWILALHQILLILLIVGKWLLPLGGGVTRDELSQLLLIFVGTAADILEFTSETLSDIKWRESSPQLVHIILAVWTWSMLQFPLHLAVVNSKPGREAEEGLQDESLWHKHSTDIWSIVEVLFIQDGPFLVVRLTVMTYYEVFHQMLVFFAIKNFLVIILNLYRLFVLCQDFRLSRGRTVHSGADL